jgi:hypothetical protein
MTTPQNRRGIALRNLNHLRRGLVYRATTPNGTTVGEYLGMETPHGDQAILLRHRAGTESIALGNVTSIRCIAA